MYGMTLSGKYWYQDLMEFLVPIGFVQSTVTRCLFFQKYEDGSVIYLLNYVNDMLYFGTSDNTLLAFETSLAERFNMATLAERFNMATLAERFNMATKGQVHWYLATRITQSAGYDIILD